MPLKKPEDVTEKNKADSNDISADQEPTVELNVGEGVPTETMPVSDAVELHQEYLTDPEAFGIASNQSVRELRDRVEQLERQNTELRRIVEMIHESQHNVAEYIGWDVDHSPIGWEEFD